jgi:hypothetical protein
MLPEITTDEGVSPRVTPRPVRLSDQAASLQASTSLFALFRTGALLILLRLALAGGGVWLISLHVVGPGGISRNTNDVIVGLRVSAGI